MKSFVRASAVVLFSLGLSTSCMEKPELEDSDGTPASAAQVQNALIEAWGGVSPLDIKVGEFSYIEKSVAIAGLPARVIFQDGKTVQSMSDSSTERAYVILQQIAEIFENNEQKLSTSERRIRISKGPSALLPDEVSAMATALPVSVELVEQLLFACVKGKGWDVECYNLKTWESREPAPEQVASREGCEGLTDCKWTLKNISFDIVLNQVDSNTRVTSRTKARYLVRISQDAPYLSRLVELCTEGLAGSGNTQFPANICQTVKNFRREGVTL